jgi:hypothetical protein
MRASSSEAESGSREDNPSKQKSRRPFGERALALSLFSAPLKAGAKAMQSAGPHAAPGDG